MILDIWKSLSRVPFGQWLFNLFISWKIPYTGSVSPKVVEFEAGRSRVKMRDRRRIRNHLDCIHAIALMNLGEFTTGLAVVSTLSEKFRYILVHLEIDFLKKARGTVEANAVFSRAEPFTEQKTYVVESQIKNGAGECVAKVRAHWLVGPKDIA